MNTHHTGSQRRGLAILAVAVMLACATAPRTASSRKRTVETLPDGSQIVCAMEIPTGSHLAEQVCRKVYPPGYDTARIQTQTQLETPKSAVPPKTGAQ